MVVFRARDGRTLTMTDLRGPSGNFRYEILDKSNVPAEAEALHMRARESGGAGDYENAIALLEQASSMAPAWPYPVYDMAFTYLLTGDADSARKYYRKTLELAPRGFFTAITALDALDRESKGELPAGTYLSYLSLEWILLINKALIMERSGAHEDAVQLLGELALDPTSTYATEHLAKVTLASIAGGPGR